MEDRICGTCKWHRKELDSSIEEWTCWNIEAEDYGYFTYYEDHCEDWEAKD